MNQLDIPEEIWEVIRSFLNPRSRVALRNVNKSFERLGKDYIHIFPLKEMIDKSFKNAVSISYKPDILEYYLPICNYIGLILDQVSSQIEFDIIELTRDRILFHKNGYEDDHWIGWSLSDRLWYISRSNKYIPYNKYDGYTYSLEQIEELLSAIQILY